MCVAKSAIFRQNKQKSPKTVKNILIYYTNRVVLCRIQTRFVFGTNYSFKDKQYKKQQSDRNITTIKKAGVAPAFSKLNLS